MARDAHTPPARSLDELRWRSDLRDALPGDDGPHDPTPRPVVAAGWVEARPEPVAAPRLVGWSGEVADLLGLDVQALHEPDVVAALAGNHLPAGAAPFAAAYGGHQFGTWAGQLGDGRAISLGEVSDAQGKIQQLQLKGAGPTAFSRTADGRAVLRSSLREFLCSEAMHHLGIPTTRALSLVTTGQDVVRDVLYDGNPAPEPGAICCRVAPSFLRIGSLELPAARGDERLLRATLALAMRHAGHDVAADDAADAAGEWFRDLCIETAELVAAWMRVGFVHGVLNTDNVSLLGLTIDYGPYGWLEPWDPDWTPNTTDADRRRYRFGMQPTVMQWNLLQCARALSLVVEDTAALERGLAAYAERYRSSFRRQQAERLGWGSWRSDGRDLALVDELEAILARSEVDHVLLHRRLSRIPTAPEALEELAGSDLVGLLDEAIYDPAQLRASGAGDALADWIREWAARARDSGIDEQERRGRMDALNPLYVPRNYLAQEAIDAAEGGDTGLLHELHDTLRHPYDEQPGRERFARKRPEWARTKVGCSMLSCSS